MSGFSGKFARTDAVSDGGESKGPEHWLVNMMLGEALILALLYKLSEF